MFTYKRIEGLLRKVIKDHPEISYDQEVSLFHTLLYYCSCRIAEDYICMTIKDLGKKICGSRVQMVYESDIVEWVDLNWEGDIEGFTEDLRDWLVCKQEGFV